VGLWDSSVLGHIIPRTLTLSKLLESLAAKKRLTQTLGDLHIHGVCLGSIFTRFFFQNMGVGVGSKIRDPENTWLIIRLNFLFLMKKKMNWLKGNRAGNPPIVHIFHIYHMYFIGKPGKTQHGKNIE